MTTILTVPPSLDETTFETLLKERAALPDGARVVVDARHTRWSSPYGLVALLSLGQSFDERAQFIPPEEPNTASYWGRSGFLAHAASVYEFGQYPVPRPKKDSTALLEVTPIAQTEDVQHVVAHIQERSKVIMEALGFPPSSSMGFSVVISESCQNVIEHAGGPGWVAVQAYNWGKRLGRRVVQIAVSDAGVGFRQSLAPTRGASVSRWDDGAALEAAVMRSTSRFHDPGRGQGLAGIRRYVKKWDAKLTIRSGTARIGLIPTWDDEPSLLENLSPFSGAQMEITIPQLLTP